eukprot:gene2744-1729_t
MYWHYKLMVATVVCVVLLLTVVVYSLIALCDYVLPMFILWMRTLVRGCGILTLQAHWFKDYACCESVFVSFHFSEFCMFIGCVLLLMKYMSTVCLFMQYTICAHVGELVDCAVGWSRHYVFVLHGLRVWGDLDCCLAARVCNVIVRSLHVELCDFNVGCIVRYGLQFFVVLIRNETLGRCVAAGDLAGCGHGFIVQSRFVVLHMVVC